MYKTKLDNRALVLISGEEAEKFLENIITCKVEGLSEDQLTFGALLNPQGKILFDFFILRTNQGFIFDLNENLQDDFIKRMTFYKLRAKVEIAPVTDMQVYADWGNSDQKGTIDPRSNQMGYRIYSIQDEEAGGFDYLQHRIECGIPEGGFDFLYGDAYPHEVLMDQFGGVDFKKGCFVGQEVVSRMQHRGTTKKRVIKVQSDSPLPASGTPISADGKPAGFLGSTHKNDGLALLRLDRVAEATEIIADTIHLTTSIQDWVNFTMPIRNNAANEG